MIASGSALNHSPAIYFALSFVLADIGLHQQGKKIDASFNELLFKVA
jgi:hypothetical protein